MFSLIIQDGVYYIKFSKNLEALYFSDIDKLLYWNAFPIILNEDKSFNEFKQIITENYPQYIELIDEYTNFISTLNENNINHTDNIIRELGETILEVEISYNDIKPFLNI